MRVMIAGWDKKTFMFECSSWFLSYYKCFVVFLFTAMVFTIMEPGLLVKSSIWIPTCLLCALL